VGAEGMVKKCANPYCPGTNTNRSQIGCAVIKECLRATPLLHTTRQACRFELAESSLNLNLKFHRRKLVLPLALLVQKKHFQLRRKKVCARQLAAVHPKSSKVVF